MDGAKARVKVKFVRAPKNAMQDTTVNMIPPFFTALAKLLKPLMVPVLRIQIVTWAYIVHLQRRNVLNYFPFQTMSIQILPINAKVEATPMEFVFQLVFINMDTFLLGLVLQLKT